MKWGVGHYRLFSDNLNVYSSSMCFLETVGAAYVLGLGFYSITAISTKVVGEGEFVQLTKCGLGYYRVSFF